MRKHLPRICLGNVATSTFTQRETESQRERVGLRFTVCLSVLKRNVLWRFGSDGNVTKRFSLRYDRSAIILPAADE